MLTSDHDIKIISWWIDWGICCSTAKLLWARFCKTVKLMHSTRKNVPTRDESKHTNIYHSTYYCTRNCAIIQLHSTQTCCCFHIAQDNRWFLLAAVNRASCSRNTATWSLSALLRIRLFQQNGRWSWRFRVQTIAWTQCNDIYKCLKDCMVTSLYLENSNFRTYLIFVFFLQAQLRCRTQILQVCLGGKVPFKRK